MHKGPVGIDALNTELRARLNPDGAPIAGTPLRVGDRVMQTRNNHEHELFNGERGVLVHHDGERDRVVLAGDDGRRLTLPVDALDTIRLAYALSVHKAQGSQATAVVVPVFRGHHDHAHAQPALHRGHPRAGVCVVVGEPTALASALRRPDARGATRACASWWPDDASRVPAVADDLVVGLERIGEAPADRGPGRRRSSSHSVMTSSSREARSWRQTKTHARGRRGRARRPSRGGIPRPRRLVGDAARGPGLADPRGDLGPCVQASAARADALAEALHRVVGHRDRDAGWSVHRPRMPSGRLTGCYALVRPPARAPRRRRCASPAPR